MKKLLALVSLTAALLFTGCSSESPVPKQQAEQKGVSTKKMANFRAVPVEKAQLLQDGKGKNFCPVCGMTLSKFYKTNHAAKHNGKDIQYCSIHCMTEDKEVNGKELKEFMALDNESLKFKDSNSMFFVVGSSKPGTMSAVSKYGFATKAEADKFASKFGGEVMSFDDTYSLVKGGLKKDIAATKKRQAKAAMMGKKIYNKMCNKTSMRFSKPADAKTYLVENKVCGNLKGKKLQMVALYLSGKGKGFKGKAGKCAAGKCASGKCGESKKPKSMKCGGGKCSAGKCSASKCAPGKCGGGKCGK